MFLKIKLAFLFACFCFFNSPDAAAQGFKGCATGSETAETYSDEFDQKVLELINIERKKRKLKALEWNEQLANAARYHAKDMALDNYMEHDSYDRVGKNTKKVCSTFDRMAKFTKGIFACAENIAAGAETPEEVVKDWMGSKGHRDNILNKSAKYLGCGCYYNENSSYGLYWSQSFGY